MSVVVTSAADVAQKKVGLKINEIFELMNKVIFETNGRRFEKKPSIRLIMNFMSS